MRYLRGFRWRPLLLISFVSLALGYWAAAAQEPKEKEKEAPKVDAPAEATPAPAEAKPAEASALPPYMTATSPDPKAPLWPDAGGGNAGYWTTPAPGPVGDGDPATKTPADLYARIVHNLFSINMVWTLIAGFLVMFMQAGFAIVETGLCRAKNAGHTMSMNMMIYPLGCIAFYVYGFALGWGNWWNGPVPDGWYASLGPGVSILNSGIGIGGDSSTPGVFKYGLMGTKGFCLMGMEDVSIMALFFFMVTLMDTTATITTGAMAERWAWKNFCLFGLWVAQRSAMAPVGIVAVVSMNTIMKKKSAMILTSSIPIR